MLTSTFQNSFEASTITEVNRHGGRITELGFINHKEALLATASSKYPIFPSLCETLGLGLVEAGYLGCKLLASESLDLDEIVKPSLKFDAYDPQSIANSVQQAISTETRLPQVLLENRIESLVELLRNERGRN